MIRTSLSPSHRAAIFTFGWLLSVPLFAQTDLPALPVSQLNKPTGWQLAGAILPGSGNTLNTKPGDALLIGSGNPLSLATPTEDFTMRFEMLATPNADVSLQLPTGQRISFQNEHDMAKLLKAPGLWQTVELNYRTGKDSQPAMLEKLVVNGVTVREGEWLPGKASSPLALAPATGTVAVRNVGYRVLSPRMVAKWSGPLSYTVYEGENSSRSELKGKKVLKQDTTSMLNYEAAYGQPRRYSVLFSGKLNALQTGNYSFDLQEGGYADLRVDGKEAIATVQRELGQPTIFTTNLTAGLHTVDVFFGRNWSRPGLGLFVSQVGTRPQALHTLSSLPEPVPIPLISIKPEVNAERIRSFIQLPGETHKRTHSLSVGSPSGYHYTVDLDQMALLQVWKGDFANVTEMWYERGEPQLLETMGTTVRLPAQSGLAFLPAETTVWPDSTDEKTLQYKGMSVDKMGYPAIEYTLSGAAVTDVIRPERDGISRMLRIDGMPKGLLYCRVAAGQTIDDMGSGLYAINDRSYFIRIDPTLKPRQRSSGGKQELLLPVSIKNGLGSVGYSVIF